MIKYSSIFKEFSNMSKINHMKKLIECLNVFIEAFRVIQDVMVFKQVFLLSDMSFKFLLKLIYTVKKKGGIILIEWGWNKNISYHESYGKTYHKMEHNIREYHISG